MKANHRTASAIVEVAEYVATAIGMAVACSSFAMLGQLFTLASGSTLLFAIAGAGLLCAIIAMSIGELASMFPFGPGRQDVLSARFWR